VQLMRTRDRAAGLDFSEVLAEEVEAEMKEAAAISMGTDISESDILNILALCEQARTGSAGIFRPCYLSWIAAQSRQGHGGIEGPIRHGIHSLAGE